VCRGTVDAGELQNSQASNKQARDSNDHPLVIYVWENLAEDGDRLAWYYLANS